MRFLTIAPLAIAMSITTANAEIKWNNASRPYLVARSDEPESDASLRALCRTADAIEVRVGGREQVGKGKGDAVRLRFVSDGQQADVRGVSRRSDDFEMTAGTELVTELKASDPLFGVLRLGKPVTLSGSLKKTVTWAPSNMASAVKDFLTACTGN